MTAPNQQIHRILYPRRVRNGDLRRSVNDMKSVIVISLLVFVAGCMPLKQIEWYTSTHEIGISPESDESSVSILAGTDNPTNKPSIDITRSYAISPSGKRYVLRVTKNEFAAKYVSPWTSDYVSLVDPASNHRCAWVNGDWELDLFFTGPIPREPIKSKFKLWTFWYCPLIHGTPN